MINVERHGREVFDSGLNISRTVGWFANISPLMMEISEWLPPLSSNHYFEVLKQVQSVPDRGIGYGLLRYLGSEREQSAMRRFPGADVFFNFLGKVGQEQDLIAEERRSSRLKTGLRVTDKGLRRHQIEINAVIQNGRLQLRWESVDNCLDWTRMQALVEEFRSTLKECLVIQERL